MRYRYIISLVLTLFLSSFLRGGIIYEDDFSGPGSLNLDGQSPDIDNNGGTNTWIAHSDWKADGTAGDYSSATLPFIPTTDKIYRLEARITDVVGDDDWMALGFAAGSSTSSGANDDRFISGTTAGQPWMLRRGDSASSSDQTFAGPGTNNGQGNSSTLDRASDVDFCIILDTRPTQWQVSWWQKLTSESTYLLVREFTYSSNPSIEAVGMAASNIDTTGDFDYFLLEEIDVVLEIVPEGQPEDVSVWEGNNAAFQAVFVSSSSPSVTWYLSEQTGDTPVNTSDPDITVTVGYDSQTEQYTTELEIQNAESQDEGVYYCIIENDEYSSVQSDTASLDVQQLVAHWSMNESDYDGNYLDTVAGYIIEPTGTPSFITGVRAEPEGAVEMTLSSGWGLSETFDFEVTDGFTISLWANWSGDRQEPNDADDLVVESPEYEFIVENGMKNNQLWQHVCVTFEQDELKIYINAKLKATESWEAPEAYDATVAVGNIGGEQIFNGGIDDIRLYNYALNQTEINQLVSGNANCILAYASEYDISGPFGLPDCMVSMYDLEEFSHYWLESCSPQDSLEYDFSGPEGLPDDIVNLYDLAAFSNHWLDRGW